jgi:choline dehydrogenase-like flavoprotein
MIEAFRQGSINPAVETDVCIIGGGAAGITIALALIGSGLRCCVLESGGMQPDAVVQSLGDVEQDHTDWVYTCHTRALGGATNHWGGWCTPLDAEDFEVRPWVDGSGWPIRKEDIDGYYKTAQEICGLGPYGYTARDLADESRDYAPFNTGKIITNFYQFSSPPKRFGQDNESVLREAEDLRVLLGATVTHLDANSDASAVTAANVRTLDGVSGKVRARHFVVACGAIQNARLLLLSNEREQGGLGNGNDLVGRHFMQHPHVPCANLLAADVDMLEHLFSRFEREDYAVCASLGPSAGQQRQQQILNCTATLGKTPDPVSGYGALREVWRDLKFDRWPDELGEKVWRVVSDLDSLADGPKLMTLYMRSEQSPNPHSRVMLGKTRDRLGLPRARVEWKLTGLDKRTVYVAARLIGEEFARLKFARTRLPDWLTDKQADWPSDFWGGCHHMGATRMSDSPGTGVVDPDCRLHGVSNVYLAGSSVFPTVGHANPTLTIVALSLRLADHLKTLYA